jgi:YhcH/YjgK/YiaL family protein
MILDTLDNADRYTAMHPAFKRVFAFLRSPSLKAVEPGRLDLDGSRLYAIATHLPGRSPDEARLEARQQYIDVHFLITGKESIGWSGLPFTRERLQCFIPVTHMRRWSPTAWYKRWF